MLALLQPRGQGAAGGAPNRKVHGKGGTHITSLARSSHEAPGDARHSSPCHVPRPRGGLRSSSLPAYWPSSPPRLSPRQRPDSPIHQLGVLNQSMGSHGQRQPRRATGTSSPVAARPVARCAPLGHQRPSSAATRAIDVPCSPTRPSTAAAAAAASSSWSRANALDLSSRTRDSLALSAAVPRAFQPGLAASTQGRDKGSAWQLAAGVCSHFAASR